MLIGTGLPEEIKGITEAALTVCTGENEKFVQPPMLWPTLLPQVI
jgi:hypothetical protein